MKRMAIVVLAGITLVLAARPAQAQLRIAPEIAWGEDADLAIGGRLLLSLGRLASNEPNSGILSKLDGVVSFDYFTGCDECSYFEINTGVLLPLTIQRWGPYIGTGLNFARISLDETSPGVDSSDTDIGLGLTGGLLVPIGNQQAFVEIRKTVGGTEQLVVTVGLQIGG